MHACKGFPDCHETIEDIIAEGDKVWHRFKSTGTHTGEFVFGKIRLAPTGKRARVYIHPNRISQNETMEKEQEMEKHLEKEEILGVIHTAIPRFYASPEIYDLFFTDKRLIGAIVLSRKAAIGYNLLSAGYGMTSYYLAKREIETYRKTFEGRTPEEILLLDSDNFGIHYKDVSWVSLCKRFLARIFGAGCALLCVWKCWSCSSIPLLYSRRKLHC